MVHYIRITVVAILVGALSACTAAQDPDTPEHAVASVDGSLIRYETRGQGNLTIVFVHCWTCSHEFWDAQFDHFAANHQVVWVDLAGHGQSGSQRANYTMQLFGQDVAAVVEKIGARRVVLVGHSMGGPVVLEAAKLLGDRVVGVVGVDVFYTPFVSPLTPEQIEAFVKPFEEDYIGASQQMVKTMFTDNADSATREKITGAMPGAGKTIGISAMYEIFRWNAEQGEATRAQFADRLYNINAAPTGAEKPLHKSVVLVPGVGHFIPQVSPDEFNRVLEEILDKMWKGKTSSGA